MGNTLIVTNLTDEQIEALSSVLGGADAAPAAKKGKAAKGKASKTEAIETSGEETTEDAPVEIHKEKALLKKERAELVAITEALGIPETETKGKRVPTLTALILAKQEALSNADSDGDDDDFTADDDAASEWDEDVPPAKEEKPKKKKGKKGKKNKG